MVQQQIQTTQIASVSLGVIGISLIDDIAITLGIGGLWLANPDLHAIVMGFIFVIIASLVLIVLYFFEKIEFYKHIHIILIVLMTSFTIGFLYTMFIYPYLKLVLFKQTLLGIVISTVYVSMINYLLIIVISSLVIFSLTIPKLMGR